MRQTTLVFDPSGNYYEGKGTTGWCIANGGYLYSAGQIYAAEYKSQMEYWTAVVDLIKKEYQRLEPDTKLVVVCEDYRLYASASQAQIDSNLETPQLIGVIKWCCNLLGVECILQMAAEVKVRWSDEVMERKGMIHKMPGNNSWYFGSVKLQHHSMDAVRHCMHYLTFKAHLRNEAQARPVQIVRKRKDWCDYEEANTNGFRHRKEVQYGHRV